MMFSLLAMMNVGIASSASDFIDELSPIFPSEPVYVICKCLHLIVPGSKSVPGA